MQCERWLSLWRGVSGWWPGARSCEPPLQRAVRVGPGPGRVGAQGLFVRAAVPKCDRPQLLLDTEHFKLKNGHFKQKQGGHPGSLSGSCNHLLVSSDAEDFAHLF